MKEEKINLNSYIDCQKFDRDQKTQSQLLYGHYLLTIIFTLMDYTAMNYCWCLSVNHSNVIYSNSISQYIVGQLSLLNSLLMIMSVTDNLNRNNTWRILYLYRIGSWSWWYWRILYRVGCCLLIVVLDHDRGGSWWSITMKDPDSVSGSLRWIVDYGGIPIMMVDPELDI